jgi:hypothetical protein
MRVVDDGSGAIASLASGGVALLHPQEQVFTAMLTGWRNQQLARRLAFSTVEQRERMVRAFAAHAQTYPWQWTAQLVDEWMTDLRAVRGVPGLDAARLPDRGAAVLRLRHRQRLRLAG